MHIKTSLSAAALALATFVSAPQAASAQEYFIGQIITVAFNFCPRGSSRLDGQLQAINSNQNLFSLIGTIYGGDGRVTFALPEARGRRLVSRGTNSAASTTLQLGQRLGSTTAVMTEQAMPAHSHPVLANNLDGDRPGPGDKLLAAAPTGGTGNETIYSTMPPNKVMSSQMIAETGGGQAFSVQDPYLGMTKCIITQGTFPSRN
ncbi:tail fiber protein [Jannaschia sp.]|nr:tail fiber protein [Jannaschia sp.]